MRDAERFLGVQVWPLNRSKLYKEKSFEINWALLFDLSLGSRAQKRNLILSAQEFFLAIFGQRSEGEWVLSPNVMKSEFSFLRSICRWMIQNSIWNFSQITFADVVDFLQSRRPRIYRKNAVVSERYIKKFISVFQLMWDMRSNYRTPISFNIAEFRDDIILSLDTRPDIPWLAIDKKDSLDLLHVALDWIERFGPAFMDLKEKFYGLEMRRGEFRYVHTFEKARLELFQRMVESESFTPFRLGAENKTIGDYARQVRIAASMLEGACAYALLLLLGIRLSELLALDADCLVVEKGADGIERTYVSGPAAKKAGLERRWVAGDAAVKIIDFLAKLYQVNGGNEDCLGRSKGLLLMREKKIAFDGTESRRWTAKVLYRKIKEFVFDSHQLTGVALSDFHVHMTRKSFAQLAVLRNKSMLGPVAAQFGHVYRDFTDRKYVGADYELSRMLDLADRRELAAGIEKVLTSDVVAGKAAHSIQSAREDIVRFRGKKTLTRLVEQLIDRGVSLAPCDWGYCLYSRSYSACQGDANGPNEVRRAPDVCAGCNNFLATRENLRWWEERVSREESFLQIKELSEQSRMIAEQRLSKSQNILLTLVSPSKIKNTHEQ